MTPDLLELRPVGRSALTVTSLGLGTAALAVPYGAPGAERAAPPRAVAADAVAAALDAGIQLIDTAPAYGDAESIVGDVAGDADCRVATKLAIPRDGWLALDGAATRSTVRASAESSLRALRRERLDLLQIHNADIELLGRSHVVQAIEELRSEGLVALIGATVYGEDNALAALDLEGIDVVQVAHSALDRRAERSIVPRASAAGASVMTRSALLRGVLTPAGRDLSGVFAPLREAADAFRVAIGAGWEELPGAAVAWAATRPGITSTIIGPRDAGELADLLAGAEAFLTTARDIGIDWWRELAPELLDPRSWPQAQVGV